MRWSKDIRVDEANRYRSVNAVGGPTVLSPSSCYAQYNFFHTYQFLMYLPTYLCLTGAA